MRSSKLIDLRFKGDYALCDSVSLAARAAFVPDVSRDANGEPGTLDLMFSLEGSWSTVGAIVDQHNGRVRATVLANPGGAVTDDIRHQLERILCLDVDGAAFEQVAARDEIVERLRELRPGVRPVLFPSPYEAAARAIIGQQLPVRLAAAIHARIAEEYGVVVTLGKAILHAFPAPAPARDRTILGRTDPAAWRRRPRRISAPREAPASRDGCGLSTGRRTCPRHA